jgi:hypothetical protein
MLQPNCLLFTVMLVQQAGHTYSQHAALPARASNGPATVRSGQAIVG